MRQQWITICLLFAAAYPAAATDLAKIDRRIGKEPAYQTKPQYCLLVFGPDARLHVWVVLDGNVLYADCNGNGDLTEPGKRIARSKRRTDVVAFENIQISDPSDSFSYKFTVYAYPKERFLTIWVIGKLRQYSSGSFSERREEAPVLHFGGPLSMGLASDTRLRCGGETELRVHIGTRGWSKEGERWALVTYDNACIPLKAEPLVEIEYPSLNGNGTVRKLTARLTQRC